MQYFHNETLISSHNSKRSQKRRERAAKAQAVLEGYEAEREIRDALDLKEEKLLTEEFYNEQKVSNLRSKPNYEKIHHETDVFNEKFDEICKDLFFYTVYESLLIDDDIKTNNFNYIKNECYKFFDDFNKKNLLSIKEGSGFGDVMDTASRLLQEAIDENEGVDVKSIIKKCILSEDLVMYYATESIKLKTADCLNTEKKGTILKEQLESEDKYVDPSKSLFRVLFEANIQDTIDNSTDIDPDSIQDISLVETILDYTILETANTLQLVKFRNLKKVLN